MGMFDWLFKTGVGPTKILPENRGLPTPNRSATPIPKCIPPYRNPAPVMDISEPVITLLAELGKDVWELTYKTKVYSSFTLTHVYKEDIRLTFWTNDTKLVTHNWMTEAERKAVQDAAKINISGQVELHKETRLTSSRNKFSKQIGAPIDNN